MENKMRQYTKNMMLTAALLLSAVVARGQGDGQNVTENDAAVSFVIMLNGVENTTCGTANASVVDGVCTLTLTPAEGNYITSANLTAVKIIDGGMAQAPRRAPSVDNTPISITATDANADPSETTTYTFQMPSEVYGVEVTADFQERQSIQQAEITLSNNSFYYDGNAKEPLVNSVVLGNDTLAATDYAVSYEDNTEIGEATVKVAGLRTYKDTATVHFTIAPGEAILSGEDQTVTYNGQPQAYTGGSTTAGSMVVTYFTSSDGPSTGEGASTVAPTNAGTYYVQLTQGDSHYTSEPVNVTFIIQKAAITRVKLISSTLTYNGQEQTAYIDSVKAGNLELLPSDYTVEGNTATEAGTYTVTVTANEQSNFTGSATATFSIINRTISIEDVGFAQGQTFATYYNTTESLELPEGLAAYIVTEVSGSNVLTQAIRYIPKNVPVLLEMVTDPDAAPVETIDEVGDNQNLLHGSDGSLSVNEVQGGKVYVLYNNEFVRTVSGTIPANRAYLLLSADQTAGSRLHIVVGDDETNGIDAINTTAATSDTWYDLNGRKLNGKPARRGLYLRNGKKSVFK